MSPVPTFTGLGPNPQFEDIVRKINVLVNEFRNLMLNLDDVNFDKITANVMDVNELSAITANMGTITAGIIYGAYIATANGTYPRIEFSSVGNLLTAFFDANSYVRMTPNQSGLPIMVFQSSLGSGSIFQDGTIFTITTAGTLGISGTSGVTIQSTSGSVDVQKLKVNSGTQFDTLSQADSTATDVATLKTDFNALLSKLRSMNILAP
jgi:hypothetical protein